MADTDSTTNEMAALLHLLDEIAGEASLVAELCHKACGNNGDPSLDAAAAILASRIGWLADEGLRRHERPTSRNDAKEWLLSPRMQWLWEIDKAEAH